ncbi:MAG: aldo/keto reductase family oxidoreductase [Fulvivirga sp.]
MDFSPLIIGAMRLGKWGVNFNTNEYESFINGCLDLGFDTFDHADIYGDYTTEAEFGAVLKKSPSLRKRIKLITKCGIKMVSPNRPEHKVKSYDLSADHIIKSVEHSLVELSTDHIDLLLLHRPDYLMNPEEIAGGFTKLKSEGKALGFGVSNFSTSQFDLLHKHYPLTTNQIEVSLLQRNAFDDGTLDQCLGLGLKPMAWSPLGGGALFKTSEDEMINRIQKVGNELCDGYNCGLDQLLYAWGLAHPAGIIPVLGTSNLERIGLAKAALEIKISREDWYRLWTAATGNEVL